MTWMWLADRLWRHHRAHRVRGDHRRNRGGTCRRHRLRLVTVLIEYESITAETEALDVAGGIDSGTVTVVINYINDDVRRVDVSAGLVSGASHDAEPATAHFKLRARNRMQVRPPANSSPSESGGTTSSPTPGSRGARPRPLFRYCMVGTGNTAPVVGDTTPRRRWPVSTTTPVAGHPPAAWTPAAWAIGWERRTHRSRRAR